jgi:hypothetical protein
MSARDGHGTRQVEELHIMSELDVIVIHIRTEQAELSRRRAAA